MKPDEFIAWLAEYCHIVRSRGYFPSVFVAQSILESGWGNSPLTEHFNLWGHKWRENDRYGFVSKDTPEERNKVMVTEIHRFRSYPSMEIAVGAYCDKWEERWKNGQMKYNPDFSGPHEFIESIAGTYATDSKYAGKLHSIINDWGLERFDRKV